jgi:hypothetical protein
MDSEIILEMNVVNEQHKGVVEEISKDLPMINGVVVKSKVYRKTQMVFENFHPFISNFIQENIENEKEPESLKKLYELWSSLEVQNKLRTFIYEKKISMKKPTEQVLAERQKRKEEKKEKRENRDKEIQRKRVERQQERPKSAYFFFRNDEAPLIKTEFPELDKKGVHNELQKRWKELKGSERHKSYQEIAEKVAKEKIDEAIANGTYNPNKKSEKEIKLELRKEKKDLKKKENQEKLEKESKEAKEIKEETKPKYIPPRQQKINSGPKRNKDKYNKNKERNDLRKKLEKSNITPFIPNLNEKKDTTKSPDNRVPENNVVSTINKNPRFIDYRKK